jgi:hypothetical protein
VRQRDPAVVDGRRRRRRGCCRHCDATATRGAERRAARCGDDDGAPHGGRRGAAGRGGRHSARRGGRGGGGAHSLASAVQRRAPAPSESGAAFVRGGRKKWGERDKRRRLHSPFCH